MADSDESKGSNASPGDDTVTRYRRARAIFDEVKSDGPEQWGVRVRELAAGDGELERHVLLLLAAYRDNPDFLERPESIGPYRIVEKLGEGGMGVVYLAEQQSPRRQVALKVIGFRSPEILNRFAFEQQALARMNHPNIAQVFETGATEGNWPFLAMELVRGHSLRDYCDAARPSLEERLDLFVQVCRGVEHAHRQGIIHRDLKPSNILVALRDERPVPKIIDFGIAKALAEDATEEGMLTRLGQRVGTPAYMSPEQRTGGPVDTRTDVHALGVILCELLTGDLPDPSGDGSPARSPGTGAPTAGRPRDLDWIVRKAIDPDPELRYASATELAADIERVLRHQPIQARPPSLRYRATKFARRHRLGLVMGGALLAAGTVGTIAAVQTWRAESELRREVELVERVMDSVVDIVTHPDPRRTLGNRIDPRELLDRASERVLAELGHRPRLELRVRTRIGETYRKLGCLDEAELHVRRAVELAGAEYPGPTRQRLDAINALGNIYSNRDDYEEAALSYEQALPLARAVDGEGALYAAICKNLADSYARLDRPEEALEILETALAIRETLDDHEKVIVTLTSIGDIERRLGRHEDAIETLSDALALRLQAMGPNDEKRAFGYYFRGNAFFDDSRFPEARADYEEALAIWRRTLPPAHPKIAGCLDRLAHSCWKGGDAIAAERHFLDAIRIEESLAGDDPVNLVEVLEHYAVFLDDVGRGDDAESARRRAASLT